jgi:hypothetical protein
VQVLAGQIEGMKKVGIECLINIQNNPKQTKTNQTNPKQMNQNLT